MKCSVCNADVSINDKVCTNCGTPIKEVSPTMNAGGFGSNQNSYDLNIQMPKQKSAAGKVIAVILVIFILLGAAVGYLYYMFLTVETVQFDDFSVSLPHSMKKNPEKSLSAMNMGDDLNGKAEVYGNRITAFSYAMIDYTGQVSQTELDLMTENLFITGLNATMETMYLTKYDEVDLYGNVLKCTMTNSAGQKVYSHIVCKKHGAKYYVFIFECLDKNKDTFGPKLEKWAASIEME